MGLFSSPKVPDTIGKARGERLRDRAERQQRREGGMFSRKVVDRRKASNDQQRKSIWS